MQLPSFVASYPRQEYGAEPCGLSMRKSWHFSAAPPPTDTPQRPKRIDVLVPGRSGDSIAGFSIWMVGADGRMVGQLEILVRVSIG